MVSGLLSTARDGRERGKCEPQPCLSTLRTSGHCIFFFSEMGIMIATPPGPVPRL